MRKRTGTDDQPPADEAPAVSPEPLAVAPPKNEAAVEMGRRGGLKGGAMRAARMTPEERAASARLAAQARWAKAADEGGIPKRNPDGEPFRFDLWPAEIAMITETPIAGKGGLQSLQKRIREQLERGNSVEFDNAGLGQLIRYMTLYGNGSFETRLRRAFARSFLDLFTSIFESERRT